MRRVGVWLAVFAIGVSAFAPLPVRAATPVPSGLQISPVRRELKVGPGDTVQSEIVVANLTKSDLDATLYFREFSVENVDYDLVFQPSHYDWIKISEPQLTLVSGQSKTIPFSLTPQKDASPGGYYFTIFASSTVQSGGVDSTIQAASQQYVTVDGKLDRSTRLDKIEIPTFVFSPDITYSYDMTNTGNVYYTIYSTARLSNPFATITGEPAAHTVLPGKPRHMTGSLDAPALPGFYTATIGYRTDSNSLVTVTKQVLYMPLWGAVALIGILFALFKVRGLIMRRRRTAHRR